MEIPLALGLALIIGRSEFKLAVSFRAFFFMPYVLSEVITGVLWQFIYHPQYGLVKAIVQFISPSAPAPVLFGNPRITLSVIVLPQVAFQIPLQCLLLRGFFRAIPNELEDASQIDGCGPLGFFWYMVVPLSTPILATSGVLTRVVSWNNFSLPLLVFNNNTRFTLPMGVMDFMGEHSTGWNLVLGYLSLAMIPAILLFIFCPEIYRCRPYRRRRQGMMIRCM